jgi:hypothetical protein
MCLGLIAGGLWSAAAAPAQAADGIQTGAAALARGDADAAAAIIRDNGYAKQPNVLGDILFEGGVQAVANGTGSSYDRAVATAFIKAGVPYGIALQALVTAGRAALTHGLTPAQAFYGGVAIATLNAGYVTSGAALRSPLDGGVSVGSTGLLR